MERLTYGLGEQNRSYGLVDKASAKPGLFTDYDGFYAFLLATHKLGKYEDTGLTPEEINDLMIANGEKVAEISRLRSRLVEVRKENIWHLSNLLDDAQQKLAEVTAERDAAVEDLTRLANGNKDCGACAHIGDSIDKCEYTHTGDCFEWRGLRKETENEKVQG